MSRSASLVDHVKFGRAIRVEFFQRCGYRFPQRNLSQRKTTRREILSSTVEKNMLGIDVGAAIGTVIRLALLALRTFLAFCWLLLGSLRRAILRNFLFKPLPAEELSLPLLAARLADLPYQVETAEQVQRSLETLLEDAKLLHFQEQQLMATHAVWFLCEGRIDANGSTALFLVFRGTMSPTDAIADVLFRPEPGPNGVPCHGGFLRTVRDDGVLHQVLAKHAGSCGPAAPAGAAEAGTRPRKGGSSTGDTGGASDGAITTKAYTDVYIMGHSLGGALSQTIVGAGFLPSGLSARLTVVTLGGPMVFYGEVDPARLEGAAAARVLSVVNANDIVPRLLGCPLSFSRSVLPLRFQQLAQATEGARGGDRDARKIPRLPWVRAALPACRPRLPRPATPARPRPAASRGPPPDGYRRPPHIRCRRGGGRRSGAVGGGAGGGRGARGVARSRCGDPSAARHP